MTDMKTFDKKARFDKIRKIAGMVGIALVAARTQNKSLVFDKE